ncbi:MAG: hypothetical protein Ct9H90mP30_7100 [Actinomycetota bacterium]|nr:MAG: hypothetical protein Ct9H90mP30_7100 [Actinomycetota bacterium]
MKERPSFLICGKEIGNPETKGSLIRTAAAASAEGIIFTKSSVDLYNPKTVRASAGQYLEFLLCAQCDPLIV